MRNLMTISTFILLSFLSFSQDNGVKKIQEAQDTRKKYIDFESKEDGMVKAPEKWTYVNPFIGTGGHGHTFPGATAPFGMMQLSPDTRVNNWDACGGYHYSDSIIYGFSHTHLSGTGVEDYSDLLIVPQSGKLKTTPGYKDPKGYGSKFSHARENASPGFYSVSLLDSKINVRLTASDRSGMHEYTFLDKKAKKYILIDLDHKDKLLNSSLIIENNTTVKGSRISESWAKEQHFYFHLTTNIPFIKSKQIIKNGQHKLVLEFPKDTEKLLIKVGMSAVDINGAQKNVSQEIPHWDFNQLKEETLAKWNAELNRIDFFSIDRDIMVKFYTSLYHSYIAPNLFSDVDGRYRGMDQQIHQLENPDADNQYTVFSIWDTYRATHPLYTLSQPKRNDQFISTFLRQYNEVKGRYERISKLPVWELAANETNCMIGYHAVSIIADAYTKNTNSSFNSKEARNALISSTFDVYEQQKSKKNSFFRGFTGFNEVAESVSKTLEYAYDEYCISRYLETYYKLPRIISPLEAKIKPNDGKDNFLRSLNFINVFDPKTKFMRARNEGLWYSPFDPSEVNFNYTEANSWQYSLYAPHAVGVLSDLLGGKDSLSSWLDRLFTTNVSLTGRNQLDITGLIGQYAHGNEPSHHIAYLYNYTNQATKTQFYADKIMREMYTTKPDGLAGNEDCGQMSSWYVMSAMGLYQIAPGNPYYDFGRPLALESIIELADNKRFRIRTIHNNDTNKYIQRITLNGNEIKRLYIEHSEILEGGILEFEMGNTPNPLVDKYEHAPTITEVPKEFVPIPHFENESKTFKDSIQISINYPHLKDRKFDIYYSLSTSINKDFKKYTSPITLKESTEIEIYLEDANSKLKSSTLVNEFSKKDTTLSFILSSTFSKQYSAGGKDALIDKNQSKCDDYGSDYRTGEWQGFLDQDLKAEITFSLPRKVSSIEVSCIQDINAWIFFPQLIEYEISVDGINFKPLTKAVLPSNKVGNPNTTWTFPVQTNTNEAIKKIRIKAINFGNCPKGHPGEGNPTFIFADEILFR